MLNNFIIFTFTGEGLPVAKKLQDEGKNVWACQVHDAKSINEEESPEENSRRLKLYEGILNKISVVEALKLVKTLNPEETFLFFDMNFLWPIADKFRDSGCRGLFPTKEDHALEADRDKAKALVKKYYPEIEVAPIYEFKKIEEAIKFLEEDDENMYVLKGNNANVRTVVPTTDILQSNHDEITEALQEDKKEYESKGFILELMIIEPIETTPQAIFYNGELAYMSCDIENKPIGTHNTSFQTGCCHSLLFPIDKNSMLAKMSFPPYVESLAKKHQGLFVWDISILIDKKTGRRYFGEFCSNRMGYDSLFGEIEMSRSATGYFEDIIETINPLIRDFGATIRLFNLNDKAPYLYKNNDLLDKEINVRSDNGIWLMDCYLQDEILRTCGYSMDLGAATGYGKNVKDAFNMAYDNAEMVGLKNIYFRHDALHHYPTSIRERYEYIKLWM